MLENISVIARILLVLYLLGVVLWASICIRVSLRTTTETAGHGPVVDNVIKWLSISFLSLFWPVTVLPQLVQKIRS